MNILIGLVYLFIAYGSLFPFDFSYQALQNSSGLFLNTQVPSIGDLLGNILLFAPLGFLYGFKQSASQPISLSAISIQLWIKVAVFALILQLLQIALPGRDQNIVDVALNLIGFAGAFWGLKLIQLPSVKVRFGIHLLPLAIGALFIFSELSPFVPSIDFQGFKNSIKPLLSFGGIEVFEQIVIHLIWWLLAFRLMFFGRTLIPVHFFAIGLLLFISAKVIIYYNFVHWHDVIAPIIAFIVIKHWPIAGVAQVKLFIAMVVTTLGYTIIASFGASDFQAIQLLPFYSYLNGELYLGLQALVFKLFVYMGIIWLTIEAGLNAKKSAIGLAIFVLVGECLQLFMPSRTFDIADPLLVIASYMLVRHLGDYLAALSEQTDESSREQLANSSDTAEQFATASEQLQHTAEPAFGTFDQDSKRRLKRQGIIFAASFLVFYALISFTLSLPGVPYNFKELFSDGDSPLHLLAFYLFIIAIGGSSSFVCQRLLQKNNVSALNFIQLHFITITGVFVLLSLAVPKESLQDILGASLYAREVYAAQTDASVSALFINIFSVSLFATFVEYFEYFLRFAALFGLLQVPLTLILLVQQPEMVISKVKAFSLSLLLLILSFYLVFYAAATDNITELVARPWMVVVLLILFAFAVNWQRSIYELSTRMRWFKILTISVIFSYLSWYVAQLIFEPVIIKYGYTFSALDFILGPDRSIQLTQTELILRWCTLVVLMQLVTLYGLGFVHKLANALSGVSITGKLSAFKLKFLPVKFNASTVTLCLGVWLLGYLVFRLFGPSHHWQTVTTYFSAPTSFGFSEDQSTALLPINPQPGVVTLNGQLVRDLESAFNNAKDNDEIRIAAGYYNSAVKLNANYVKVIAEQGAVIYGKAKEGKGAILVNGDGAYIEGIECHSIAVNDNNGVCIRLQGRGITLNKVYFHHSQGGLLGSPKGGDIRIINSKFEHMGMGAFYHGIYTLAPTRLFIENSQFLNTRNGGHEVKSRSSYTEIKNSTIASTNSRDSRLIDVPNGGVLVLENNVLVEGPYSENNDLLSWGVEGITHSVSRIQITNNIIISDKHYANFISLKEQPESLSVADNIVVGDINGISKQMNTWFNSRAELSIPPAPQLPVR